MSKDGLFPRAMLFIIVFVWGAGFAQPSAGEWRSRPSWLNFVPGGGQIYLGQTAAGIACMAGTAGLAGWGIWAERVRAPGEINVPLVYAQQLYVISFYSAYRDIDALNVRARASRGVDSVDVRSRGDKHRDGGPRPERMSDILGAPFSVEHLTSPWVLGFAALGVGLNLFSASVRKGRRSLVRVSSVSYLGRDYGRSAGTAAYAAHWIPLSYGAGESEEMLFRGMLQRDWEERFGSIWGLVAASGAFGLAHVTDPRDDDSWYQAGFAAMAGMYLGWRYQRTGYRLGEPIAAHVWFDILAGITVFLVDPTENPLGVRVKFAL